MFVEKNAETFPFARPLGPAMYTRILTSEAAVQFMAIAAKMV
jgi:hypothetical protein